MTVDLHVSPATAHTDRAGDRAAVVTITDIRKSFAARRGLKDYLRGGPASASVPVLRGVTFTVRDREFFGLLGMNGAGKTTLFKILATLTLPDSGTAEITGHDVVRDAATVRRTLSPVIADERSLHWRLSARQNLRLFGALHGLDASESDARANELLDAVGLADTGTKLVASFSSGMRQKLLLARALIPRPRVLLLDEPTRSLDPVSARDFRRFLREEIRDRFGCTVLLATHIAEEVLELCDRVGVLHRGTLVAAGPAEELIRRYAGDVYQIWTDEIAARVLDGLQRRGSIRYWKSLSPDEDWHRTEVEIPGGSSQSALVIREIIADGIAVARFERVGMSLADLIERIVAGGSDGL
jgi:ABC-2 type transport system ATP-binding protein